MHNPLGPLATQDNLDGPRAKLGLRPGVCLYGGPDLVLRLLQVDVDPLRLDAVEVRVDEELDAVALGVPAAVL